MSKRPREEDIVPVWWKAAVEWIVSNDGVVHSSLHLDERSRQISVASKPISGGETLLVIPQKCLVSYESVTSTVYGKLLDRSLQEVDSTKLYNTRQDLAIALFLACHKTNKSSKETAFYKPYLDTLPASSSFDALPRRWSDEQLSSLLTGSCLLDRVKNAQEGVRSDYKLVHEQWQNLTDNQEVDWKQFPSFASFDDMLAVVSSRAFSNAGGSTEQDVALVPLLDLCNHHRGGHAKKNVSYKCQANGGVEVVAIESLSVGDNLRITYGAQGNQQLLFNYGFCIPNNLEPDGSSNDILEFVVKPGYPPVELRAGPKSYTFGGFVKALELHHTEGRHEIVENTAENDDDMEDFLNECDAEGDQFCDFGHDEDEGEDDEEGMTEASSEQAAVRNELKALDSLREALERGQGGYSLCGIDLEAAQSARQLSPRHYAAILVCSELRTIRLYLRAIDLVQKQLKQTEQLPENPKELDDLMESQAIMLARAFIAIRYPSHL